MGTIDVAAEAAIARLAAAGDALIARSALLDAGVRPSAIDDRARSAACGSSIPASTSRVMAS